MSGLLVKIVVVEDDPSLQLMIRYNLDKLGYDVSAFPEAELAWEHISRARPDAVVLDWMLPGMSGLDLCRRIRGTASLHDLPVLMLTARADEQDSIRGLDSGADDYIAKPCSIEALDARLRALLRRTQPVKQNVLNFADLQLDLTTHRAERNGRSLTLGPTEFRLLEFLMRHPRRVFSREDLLQKVWGSNVHVELRTIDVHIRRLRRALNLDEEMDYVRTVRSAGYALDDQA
ncbi:phosphate regulon transcriptional regulator PhoB [Asaia prunellae]|uniref:phosphate regulon transcriptional regulator PhoB n=1 Tax=Asaia prunellae TaxID=610245 RepID=UPI000550E806|nr:phosphate regulon transcriptional regulator PhoB [Asaia prunellae]